MIFKIALTVSESVTQASLEWVTLTLTESVTQASLEWVTLTLS